MAAKSTANEDKLVERCRRKVEPLRKRTKKLDKTIDRLRESPGMALGRKEPRRRAR